MFLTHKIVTKGDSQLLIYVDYKAGWCLLWGLLEQEPAHKLDMFERFVPQYLQTY